MLTSVQVNVWNIKRLCREDPRCFEAIRLDSNNDCNVHCVYCHNDRSKEVIATDELRRYLNNRVISANVFQVGCVMEPTLDSRLCEVLLMIAASRAKPKDTFLLQTNGILLHRHDYGKMRDAGLTRLSVSIDAADPATHKALRGGTSLSKVHSNLRAFREACPSVELTFLTTVTSINVDGMEDLVRFGLSVGVDRFVFRQMFYHEDSNIVDHTRMPGLLVTADAFGRMKELISDMFRNQAKLHFLDAPTIVRVAKKTRADSGF